MSKVRTTLAFSQEDADRFFDEMCGYATAELHSRGPDHHVELAAQRSKDVEHSAWYIGCYMGPYDVPSGEAIYNAFPSPGQALAYPEQLEDWLRFHWHNLRIRKERRPCRAPHKMAEYLLSYAEWSISVLKSDMSFEELWSSFDHVKYVGRYAGMRVAETLARAGQCDGGFIKDIRAGEGGWSPRLVLSCMRPEQNALLNSAATKKTTSAVEGVAFEVKDAMEKIVGPIGMYNFESLLCNYKQGYEGRRYPGHALDNDFDAINMISNNASFTVDTVRLFELRSQLFPHECLAEIQGWNGYRDELSATYSKYGIWWDDTVYNYKNYKTMEQFEMRRAHA